MSLTDERIIQIVPAAAGWRAIYLNAEHDDKTDEEIMELSVEAMTISSPVACFVLVERGPAEGWDRQIRSVVPQDWPSYFMVEDESDLLTYIGPGETLDGYRDMIVMQQLGQARKHREESKDEAAEVGTGDARVEGAPPDEER